MSTESNTIVVLSTPTCHRCKFVAKHLDAKQIEYDYIDLTKPENADWLAAFESRGLSNVPQTLKGESDWIEGVDLDAINRLF